MKCLICFVDFTDGVQCSICRNHLDFGCAMISETTWRKYGADKKSQWRCPSCRAPSPLSLAPSDTASFDSIMKELQVMKRQLSGLPGLSEDMRAIKQELSELRGTCDYTSQKLDELGGRLTNVENRVTNLEKLQDTVHSLQNEVSKAKLELSAQEQRSRLNNIEIKGVPIKKDENLFSIVEAIGKKVNYVVPKTQINYISRVPMHNSKEKLIIVSFINRYIKEDFIGAARTEKLTTTDMGFSGPSNRVFINDHLNADQKKLLTLTKATVQNKNYKFVWVKHGKIHVRQNESSKVIVIRNENDLNRIV